MSLDKLYIETLDIDLEVHDDVCITETLNGNYNIYFKYNHDVENIMKKVSAEFVNSVWSIEADVKNQLIQQLNEKNIKFRIENLDDISNNMFTVLDSKGSVDKIACDKYSPRVNEIMRFHEAKYKSHGVFEIEKGKYEIIMDELVKNGAGWDNFIIIRNKDLADYF
jgi:hypothetical protein